MLLYIEYEEVKGISTNKGILKVRENLKVEEGEFSIKESLGYWEKGDPTEDLKKSKRF